MARRFVKENFQQLRSDDRRQAVNWSLWAAAAMGAVAASPLANTLPPPLLAAIGLLPTMVFGKSAAVLSEQAGIERERSEESARRRGKPVLGMPPQRDAIERMVEDVKGRGKKIVDRYLVGFELETGKPLYVDDDDIITHGCCFAKTGVGKTLWLESLMLQQMARGRASGLTFIDAKRDSGTLANIILMALFTGRIEDLIVIDPFDPIHAYNFVMTNQRADVKARKVLRAGLPPTSDQSATKHYDRLAADSIYRIVRALESMGLAWSIRDVAVALSAFNVAYPQLRSLLHRIGARQAMVELGHLAASYRDMKGQLDMRRITDNLRGIASELHSISAGDAGSVFCSQYTDLVLTDAILRGKIIYFMLPRLEEAESAARMVKVFREDLEVSIGEITSSRVYNLEDPHLVIIDEGSSTFGPTWANLFELARKGRFALLFGAQSTGGLTDAAIGLSEAFYERVMANVNLKVMMRIGDNRTAMDMTEWIGKVTTLKKSIGAGVTVGKSQNFFKGNLDFSTKMTGNESQNISISEEEEDLVSSEELKHEMAAEKGLAWFDLGDGRPVKGRTFWFNSELPDTWEGREFLPQLERFERDEVGLADWVDEQILVREQQETISGVIPTPNARGTSPGPRRPGDYGGGRDRGNFGSDSRGGGDRGDSSRGSLIAGKARGALPSFSKPVLRAVTGPAGGDEHHGSSDAVPAPKRDDVASVPVERVEQPRVAVSGMRRVAGLRFGGGGAGGGPSVSRTTAGSPVSSDKGSEAQQSHEQPQAQPLLPEDKTNKRAPSPKRVETPSTKEATAQVVSKGEGAPPVGPPHEAPVDRNIRPKKRGKPNSPMSSAPGLGEGDGRSAVSTINSSMEEPVIEKEGGEAQSSANDEGPSMSASNPGAEGGRFRLRPKNGSKRGGGR